MDALFSGHLSVTSVLFYGVLAFLGYFLYSWIFDKTPKNLPPGPREWGTTWKLLKSTMTGTLNDLATEWAKKYGPLVYVNLFGRPIAFMNSADILRRIVASEEYKLVVSDRIPTAIPRIGMYNGKDMLFTKYDAIMKKKRKLLFQAFGLYGDGVERFETVVQQEMGRFFKELEQHLDEDYDLWKSLCRSLKNIIYILTLGECPPDPGIPDILEEYDLAFNTAWEPEYDYPLTFFPFLEKIPGKYKRAVDRIKIAQRKAEEIVYYGPLRTYGPGGQRGIADFIFEQREKPDNEWMREDPDHVIGFMMMVFFGAHLTTRSTLLSSFLALMNYPQVAKNIQEEADRVIGDEPPRVEDRTKMPYTEAFILEILRIVSSVPLAGVRHVASDIHIDGMTIPKGTTLLMNSWFYHHDERIWDDPWTLKPERFLNSSGQILPADDPLRKSLLPFGSGVRSCPGEVFARSRTFLIVTSILQKYDLLPPANEKPVPADFKSNNEYTRGFVRQCQPFKCRLRPRHKATE